MSNNNNQSRTGLFVLSGLAGFLGACHMVVTNEIQKAKRDEAQGAQRSISQDAATDLIDQQQYRDGGGTS